MPQIEKTEKTEIIITIEELQIIAAIMLLSGLKNNQSKLAKSLTTLKTILWIAKKESQNKELIKNAIKIFSMATKETDLDLDLEQIKRFVQ